MNSPKLSEFSISKLAGGPMSFLKMMPKAFLTEAMNICTRTIQLESRLFSLKLCNSGLVPAKPCFSGFVCHHVSFVLLR